MSSSMYRAITPDEALELTAPTDGFLCPLSANVYGIDFLEFEIKNYDSGESIFHVTKDPDLGLPTLPEDISPRSRGGSHGEVRSRESSFASTSCARRWCFASGGARERP